MEMEYVILTWDWKQSVDVSQLQQALIRVFDGTNCPRVYDIDTASDEYGMLVSAKPLTPEQVQNIWDSEE